MGFYKHKIWIATLVAANVFLLRQNALLHPAVLPANSAKVIYSLNSHPNQEIINLIQGSDKFVDFAIYTLTRTDITDALIAAKLRGLDVRGVLDPSQSTLPQEQPLIKKMKKYGIPLEIPNKPDGSLMHAKFIVTDKGYASGSYNWTTSATSYNDEVLEIGTAPDVQKQYLEIFKTIDEKYK